MLYRLSVHAGTESAPAAKPLQAADRTDIPYIRKKRGSAPLPFQTGDDTAFRPCVRPLPRLPGLSSGVTYRNPLPSRTNACLFITGSRQTTFSQRPFRNFHYPVLSFLCWRGFFVSSVYAANALSFRAKVNSDFGTCKVSACFLAFFQDNKASFPTPHYKSGRKNLKKGSQQAS